MLCLLALVLGCTSPGKDVSGADSDPGGGTGHPDSAHTGESGGDSGHESGGDSGGDSGDSGDSADPNGEWIVSALDTERFADEGYEIVTWTLNQALPDAYDSPFEDLDPTFYMVRPTRRADATGPVIVWFHGGTLGVEDGDAGDETDEIGGCSEEKVLQNAEKTLENEFLPVVASMRRGWAILIPRNDWCDYWTGLGDDDPVEPGVRYGYENVARMLDFVLDGQAGYPATGERYAWGTSAGGGAAIHVAAKYGGFSSIVSDSAPSSMFLYWAAVPSAPERIFGGPPYDEAGAKTVYYDRYAAASAETLITDLGFEVPIAVTWNRKDTLNGPTQPTSLVNALSATYTAKGIGWYEHDYSHLAPAPYYHTQSKWPQVPWGYTGQALMQFFDGEHLLWVEAEDGCLGDLAALCEVGAVVEEATDADHVAAFSNGTMIQAKSSEGSGVAWVDTLPDDLPLDTEITATMVIEIQGVSSETDPDTALGTLEYIEGATTVKRQFTAADFAPESGATTDELLAQYASTAITFTARESGAGLIRWTTRSTGRTNLDAVIYTW